MTTQLFLVQVLNGLQFGVLLFLLSAGLTLVLGIMNFVNLLHGATYMVGAYLAASSYLATGSFLLAGLFGVMGTVAIGLVVERLVFSRLYERPPLDHVLATFGLTLLFNELARILWGTSSLSIEVPEALNGTVQLAGVGLSVYRIATIGVGAAVGAALFVLIHRTRAGILIRAAASNPLMTAALGINVRRLKAMVIALGAALAAIAGLMAAPLGSIDPGMGDGILVITLVVIVTGGIGSVRGAFYAALIIGLLDTLARAGLPALFRLFLDRSTAQSAGPAVASVLIYMLMAIVLAAKPQGLFPVRHG